MERVERVEGWEGGRVEGLGGEGNSNADCKLVCLKLSFSFPNAVPSICLLAIGRSSTGTLPTWSLPMRHHSASFPSNTGIKMTTLSSPVSFSPHLLADIVNMNVS